MKRYLFFIWIVLIAVAFFLLNCQVPFFSDDISWIGSLDGKTFSDSIQCIWERQSFMWLTQNGRAMNHLFWQLTIAGGEHFYDIVITIVFVLFLYGMVNVCVPKENRIDWAPCFFISVATLYFSPDATSNFYWAAGGAHYLFPAMMSIAFILLFKRTIKDDNPQWEIPFLIIFCFVAGWTHEIFALPISFSLFCSLCLHVYRNGYSLGKKISVQLWCLMISYWAGAFLVLVSPGSWHRFAGEGSIEQAPLLTMLASKLVVSFKLFRYGRCFYFFTVLSIGFLFFSRSAFVRFAKEQMFFLLCLLSSIGIVVILSVGGRAIWSIEVFSLILSIRLLYSIKWEFLNRSLVWGVVCALVAVHQFMLIGPFQKAWNTYRSVEQQVKCDTFAGTAHMEDWHSDNLFVDSFVAHPYEMMREDIWMRSPLRCNVCKEEVWSALSNHLVLSDSLSGVFVFGDYLLPYSDRILNSIRTDSISMNLAPFSDSGNGPWLYKRWHLLIQRLWPQRYPLLIHNLYDTEYDILCIDGLKYIRIEKPIRPVPRDIVSFQVGK